MPVYNADAIVLHRIHLGETDKIVTLLTRDKGKLNAVAKGARRAGSKLSGATELFTCSQMQLAVGKSLDIISQCQVISSFPVLRGDLELLARATYLCELTDRMIEEREPNPEVFDLLLSALYLLQRAQERPDVIVHAYELRLLAERGYMPQLEACVRCGGALQRRQNGFSPSLGGVLCGGCRYGSQDAIALHAETITFLRALATAEPETLLDLAPSPTASTETARCLRWYVRYRADRDLKSAEFLDSLRAQSSRQHNLSIS
jgi:DNA repair protein RecO (recombination protein O)